jgi:hypothetical protein
MDDTVFNKAKAMGLVELVGEEPMQFPPPGGTLFRVEKVGEEVVAVTSTRKIFQLSTVGKVDERSWADLTRAYKEGWEPGQPYEYAPPPPPPVVERPVWRPAAPPAFEPYAWEEKPSVTRFQSLLRYLSGLIRLGVEYPGVSKELTRLSMAVGDWILDSEDSLEDAKSINATQMIRLYDARIKLLSGLSDALGSEDLYGATEILKELISLGG